MSWSTSVKGETDEELREALSNLDPEAVIPSSREFCADERKQLAAAVNFAKNMLADAGPVPEGAGRFASLHGHWPGSLGVSINAGYIVKQVD